MGNLSIRQKINRSRLSASERVLRKAGVVEVTVQGEGSVLTSTGRKIVLDKLWEDDALRKAVLDDVVKANKAYADEIKADKADAGIDD